MAFKWFWNRISDEWIVSNPAAVLFGLAAAFTCLLTVFLFSSLPIGDDGIWPQTGWGIVGVLGPLGALFLWAGMRRYQKMRGQSRFGDTRLVRLLMLIGLCWTAVVYYLATLSPETTGNTRIPVRSQGKPIETAIDAFQNRPDCSVGHLSAGDPGNVLRPEGGLTIASWERLGPPIGSSNADGDDGCVPRYPVRARFGSELKPRRRRKGVYHRPTPCRRSLTSKSTARPHSAKPPPKPSSHPSTTSSPPAASSRAPRSPSSTAPASTPWPKP